MSCIYFETVLEWFCLQISSDTKYFVLFGPRHCQQGLIVVIVYYFQIWNKKEHNSIYSRVISSYMGPMNIETPYESYKMNIAYYSIQALIKKAMKYAKWILLAIISVCKRL